MKKSVILAGDPHQLEAFSTHLARSGIEVLSVEKVSRVMEEVIKSHPDAIVFILPRYWDDITIFVDAIRAKKEFAETPILYVGSLIEGEDQRVLNMKGVHTLTLGPLMPQEVVRYIVDMLK
jgi:DNA-binding response OmpR family regulator